MHMISKVARSVQCVLTDVAQQVGHECRVVRRKRKFTAASLAQTFVFGFWQNPRATVEELAWMAAACGAAVTPQAIEQRFNSKLVSFLQRLLEAMVAQIVSGPMVTTKLLRRFNGVYLQDSTVIGLPSCFAEQWPGCGRGNGRAEAGLKVQVRLDLLRGSLDRLQLEPARDPDQKSCLQHATLPRGALRLADLGYFCVTTLARLAADGVYWISRIQSSTAVFTAEGQRLDVIRWLHEHVGNEPTECSILLGARERFACRLLAMRVPQEVVSRRRQRLAEHARRKGRTPSQARLRWCEWSILVTNVPSHQLSWVEAWSLMRARWQIELLFKLWKQYGLVDESVSRKPCRRVAEVFAKLIAAVLQHWLLLTSVWKAADRSLVKVARALRRWVQPIAARLSNVHQLADLLRHLALELDRIGRIKPRAKNPSHHQLLTQPHLLNYGLT